MMHGYNTKFTWGGSVIEPLKGRWLRWLRIGWARVQTVWHEVLLKIRMTIEVTFAKEPLIDGAAHS
jgi:hypothetical protein